MNIQVIINSLGIFVEVCPPMQKVVVGGVRVSTGLQPEPAVTGSVQWHQGTAVLVIGIPDYCGEALDHHESTIVGDELKGVDATKLTDQVKALVKRSPMLLAAVSDEETRAEILASIAAPAAEADDEDDFYRYD